MVELDCAQMAALLLQGGEPQGPEARRHLEGCIACRELARHGGELAKHLAAAEPVQSSASIPSYGDLAAELDREGRFPARLASLPGAVRWLLAGVAFLVPIAGGLARPRPDLGAYPPWYLVGALAALLGPALASCWLWLRPIYKLHPGRWLLPLVLLTGALVPWLLGAFPPTETAAAGVRPRALICFVSGSALALPVAALVALLGRRGRDAPGFLLLPGLAGALLGLVGLQLHCPSLSSSHLLAGHASIVLAFLIADQAVATILRHRSKPARRS